MSLGGVPTQMKTIADFLTLSLKAALKESLPSFLLRFTSSSKPGSYMGIRPFFSLRSFSASLSTHTTLLPNSARQVPVTSPTYPEPIMHIFTLILASLYIGYYYNMRAQSAPMENFPG